VQRTLRRMTSRSQSERRDVFVTGGTGYIGKRVIPMLLGRGHRVRALVRGGSRTTLPAGCEVVIGNALDRTTFESHLVGADTFLQLVGTPKPSPSKAALFEQVDLVSARESVLAAKATGVRHFVYLSVAQPASVMQAYVSVRARGEAMVRDAGLDATFLRPWYVLGPGHRWPYLLIPMYWLMGLVPTTRESARRLGLVTLPQMLRAIVHAVENPARGVTIVDVPAIKNS
jgi:uncharacterized protein YbjT (DUF2867 family)